jgi:hypothetical protein
MQQAAMTEARMNDYCRQLLDVVDRFQQKDLPPCWQLACGLVLAARSVLIGESEPRPIAIEEALRHVDRAKIALEDYEGLQSNIDA